jgi:paraquat-inducible protein A
MEYDRNLIACRNCDTLVRKRRLSGRGEIACCPRCSSTLYSNMSRRINLTSAVALAALITFLIAQAYPILELVQHPSNRFNNFLAANRAAGA